MISLYISQKNVKDFNHNELLPHIDPDFNDKTQ